MDVVDLRTFYNQPLGHLARRLIGREIIAHSGGLNGMVLAGLGFSTPYLRALRSGTERTLALMPAHQGVLHWPPEGPVVSALVHDADLPLPDHSVDHLLLVHALEMSVAPAEDLREVWRVLAPRGRLVIVVPNRRGLWARFDTTPFGHGQPYSRSQLSELLQDAMLTPESWSETLYCPPISARGILRVSNAFERVGRAISMPVGGVLIVSASKQVYQRVGQRSPRRFGVRIAPALNPRPAAPRMRPASDL